MQRGSPEKKKEWPGREISPGDEKIFKMTRATAPPWRPAGGQVVLPGGKFFSNMNKGFDP
jgi:hypothetical protein